MDWKTLTPTRHHPERRQPRGVRDGCLLGVGMWRSHGDYSQTVGLARELCYGQERFTIPQEELTMDALA
jgi:hypothetical protein